MADGEERITFRGTEIPGFLVRIPIKGEDGLLQQVSPICLGDSVCPVIDA